MRRLVAGSFAFAAMTSTFVVLPVYAAPAPEPVPVKTSTDEIAMGSVTAPAADAEVRVGSTDPVAGVGPTAPALTVSETTKKFSLVGVTWASDEAVTDTVVQIRVQHESGAWGAWTEVGQEDADQDDTADSGAPMRGGTAPLWTGPSTAIEAELVTRSGARPTDVQLDLVDPGVSAADGAPSTPAIKDTADAAMAMPDVYSRAQWGADERLRTWDPEYAPTIKAATVHHTDSGDYTAAEVPALIRSIYSYHAVSRGWGDIGYNLIVDKFGRRWEGRYGGLASTVIGAHAGGFNTGTFGVAMLGNYETIDPSPAMIDSVGAIIAWKFWLYGVDARATTTLTSAGGGTSRYSAGARVTLPTVFAHRDVGATACPGARGYAHMGDIRAIVAEHLDASRTPIEGRLAVDSVMRTRLGKPLGPEQSGPDYTWQTFEHGNLYASSSTGVREMEGEILASYLARGGPRSLGLPTTDETAVASGRGRYNHLSSGASIYWSPTSGARIVEGAIRDAWALSGWDSGPLGFPLTAEQPAAGGGRMTAFEGGDIYWSTATGAHPVYGRIRDYWLAAGGPGGSLGYPRSDELAGGASGRYSQFTGGTVYWTLGSGAHAIRGSIKAHWEARGADRGALGFPLTDELAAPSGRFLYSELSGGLIVYTPANGPKEVHGLIEDKYSSFGSVATNELGIPITDESITPDQRARYNHFSAGASVYWSPVTGAHEVHGAIRVVWSQLGWERSPLGLPTSDELMTRDQGGRVNSFVNGFIIWSPRSGTWPVLGEIARRYDSLGRETSALGYPTSGEIAVPGGRRSNFEHGSITWSSTSGALTVRTA